MMKKMYTKIQRCQKAASINWFYFIFLCYNASYWFGLDETIDGPLAQCLSFSLAASSGFALRRDSCLLIGMTFLIGFNS